MTSLYQSLQIKVLLSAFFAAVIIFSILLSKKTNSLEDVLDDGVLVVATRNSPTTYYEGAQDFAGMEYDLVTGFAEQLGIKTKFVVLNNLQEMMDMVRNENVHFAAAGLTITEDRKKILRFSEPYQTIRQQLIYRIGSGRPGNIEDIIGKHIEVVANSSHAETLRGLSLDYPGLTWINNDDLSSDELMQLVWEQVIDYTVADSNEFRIFQRYYPELRSAFDISPPQQLAWAFPKNDDKSLYGAAVKYIKRLKKTGELEHLKKKYYGHVKSFDYVGTRVFLLHIKERLPDLREFFERAAEMYNMDWRLLAAIGYQESHWNPKAKSPTGVRGIMMLTLPTAEFLGVDDRLDPEQSIFGGAEFLNRLKTRLPDDINEPDRSWMALAAYNVGVGHLHDARLLTEIRGGDPHIWPDVKESLPLLSRKQWYTKTKHGYARGWEPVKYVENIRSYYEILSWVIDRDEETPKLDIPAFEAPAI
jgi:membrane-bound lytic murein transglycosylase F